MIEIVPGTLLISDPFLKDPNFTRTVVLICEHDKEGSLGFVINKIFTNDIGELLPELEGCQVPLYVGGPVAEDTVHFIHRRPDIIQGGLDIGHGLFWGGNFEEVMALVKAEKLPKTDCKFFIGYSGWSDGQLQEELDTKSWITRSATETLVFAQNPNHIWKHALKEMGGEYAQMIHYPLDPHLN